MDDIVVMRASLDADAALKLVRGHLHDHDEPCIERRLFYPYYHFNTRGRLRWLFGERRMQLDCLVDARTGRAASADALALESASVSAESCLVAKRDVVIATHNARRYANHALSRGFRVLGNFNLELDAAKLVHRPYWIVRGASTRVLVDAVSGELHPLASVAPQADATLGPDSVPA